MINCQIRLNNVGITQIKISGHANYCEYGSDIVCSAVSILSFTIGNALLKLDKTFDLIIDKNEIIYNDLFPTKESQLLLDTLYDGLKMLLDDYKEYINIKEV